MTIAELEECWIWPDNVTRWFKERTEGYTLHVCCGESNVGDVTLDASHQRECDIRADMNNLPFRDRTFDTVVCDPPWKEIQAVGQKHGLFYELMRVVKLNGIILWNSYNMPSSKHADREEVYIRQDFEEGRVSALIKYRCYPGQTTL